MGEIASLSFVKCTGRAKGRGEVMREGGREGEEEVYIHTFYKFHINISHFSSCCGERVG